MQVDTHEAESQLSRLGELAWRGEEIVIVRAGKPYLLLLPYEVRRRRELGSIEGEVWVAEDFADTPLEVIEAFEGSGGGWPDEALPESTPDV